MPNWSLIIVERILPRGVYSIKKQNENTYLRSYIPENLGWILQDTTSYTAPPTTQEHFENLFKIAYRPEYDDYVIRSMLDNALVVYPSTYNNAPIAGRRTESDSSISTNYTWKLVYNSGYYNITYTKNGTTYYVKSLSTENNAKVVLTTNANDSGTKWYFYKYNDVPYEEVVMDKSASTLLPGESFTFVAHMVSTRIGQNGPLTYSVTNADGTTTDKATINSSTGVLQALAPGKIKVKATYSGAFAECSWDLDITEYVLVACYNNLGYWDVPNSATSQYVECNESDQRIRPVWRFIYQNNGHYLIQNVITGNYLINQNNQLKHISHDLSSFADNFHWKIFHQSDDSYRIQSKSDNNYYITEENVSHSSQDPDIQLSNTDAEERQLWFFKILEINLEVIYDQAYIDRYGNYQPRIKAIISALQNKYLETFGLFINSNAPSPFYSFADTYCSTSCNTLCSHASINECNNSSENELCVYHHNNIFNILYHIPSPSADNTVKIAFIGHIPCFIYNNILHISAQPNGLTVASVRIATVENTISSISEKKTAIHEFGHFFYAPDHSGNGGYTTQGIIEQTKDNRFNRKCIYGEDKETSEVLNDLTICDGCKARIQSNIFIYD